MSDVSRSRSATTPDGAPTPFFQATGVVKRYGAVVAVDGVDLTVHRGERVALVGESGSGKTTLLRTFNAMVRPDDGQVAVNGTSLAGTDPVELRRSVGYVQQEGGLLPHWPVLRNVALVPDLKRMPDAEARARDALERVGMPWRDFGARWPRELSGGQRQRVALARALAAGPEGILLDEPFGALDAITRGELQKAFRTMADALGVAVLLVTHDLREAVRLAHRIAVMRQGRLEQVDTPDALVARPATPYVAELLARAELA